MCRLNRAQLSNTDNSIYLNLKKKLRFEIYLFPKGLQKVAQKSYINQKKIRRSLIFPRHLKCGRHGGLMVSALDSGSRGPSSSPGRVIVLFYWARHFTLKLPLTTQECKWVPTNCQGNLTKCWGVTCQGLGVLLLLLDGMLVASCSGKQDKLRQ